MTQPTLSRAAGSTEEPLIEQTIGRHFQHMARRFREREALVSRHQAIRYTYSQLDRESSRLVSALLRMGLAKGDRAGIRAPNGVRVCALAPCGIDTDMMASLCRVEPEAFPGHAGFVDARACGRLMSVPQAAARILADLHRPAFGGKAIAGIDDLK